AWARPIHLERDVAACGRGQLDRRFVAAPDGARPTTGRRGTAREDTLGGVDHAPRGRAFERPRETADDELTSDDLVGREAGTGARGDRRRRVDGDGVADGSG